MLKNISLRFDPEEDRLAMRLVVATAENGSREYWLHITRRVCAQWRQDLQAMVDLSAQAPDRLDAPAKANVSQAHHQAMAGQAKVRTEAASMPPAEAGQPALVKRIVCGRRRNDGKWLMSFECRDKPALNLVLSSQTLHAIVDAVSRRVQSAAWGLAALPVEAVPEQSANSGLHLH